MVVRILRAHDRRPQPWQNGLGSTSQILLWPPGSTHLTFDWRVSIAEMTVEAAFSSLPGIDRTLVALGGDGIRLTVDGRVTELAEFEAVSFAGECTVSGGPRGAATRDLNLMVRRGTKSAKLRVFTAPVVHELDADGSDAILAVIGDGSGLLTCADAEPTTFGAGDGVLLRGGDMHGGDRVRLETSGASIVVTASGVSQN